MPSSAFSAGVPWFAADASSAATPAITASTQPIQANSVRRISSARRTSTRIPTAASGPIEPRSRVPIASLPLSLFLRQVRSGVAPGQGLDQQPSCRGSNVTAGGDDHDQGCILSWPTNSSSSTRQRQVQHRRRRTSSSPRTVSASQCACMLCSCLFYLTAFARCGAGRWRNWVDVASGQGNRCQSWSPAPPPL